MKSWMRACWIKACPVCDGISRHMIAYTCTHYTCCYSKRRSPPCLPCVQRGARHCNLSTTGKCPASPSQVDKVKVDPTTVWPDEEREHAATWSCSSSGSEGPRVKADSEESKGTRVCWPFSSPSALQFVLRLPGMAIGQRLRHFSRLLEILDTRVWRWWRAWRIWTRLSTRQKAPCQSRDDSGSDYPTHEWTAKERRAEKYIVWKRQLRA